MQNEYFSELVGEMTIDDIDNIYFKAVAEKFGVEMSAHLLVLFDEVYPDSKEGQRKINVPLKSTFVFRPNKRKMDGVPAY